MKTHVFLPIIQKWTGDASADSCLLSHAEYTLIITIRAKLFKDQSGLSIQHVDDNFVGAAHDFFSRSRRRR